MLLRKIPLFGYISINILYKVSNDGGYWIFIKSRTTLENL